MLEQSCHPTRALLTLKLCQERMGSSLGFLLALPVPSADLPPLLVAACLLWGRAQALQGPAHVHDDTCRCLRLLQGHMQSTETARLPDHRLPLLQNPEHNMLQRFRVCSCSSDAASAIHAQSPS